MNITDTKEKQRAKKQLERAIKNAANKWLERNELLSPSKTLEGYLASWHSISYSFHLTVSSYVRISLNGADQTFSQGYSERTIASYRVSKAELFS